jgi:hypothetical protein
MVEDFGGFVGRLVAVNDLDGAIFTGRLKKCAPATCSDRVVVAAMSEMDSDEVFDVRMTWSGACSSTVENRFRLADSFSGAASTTRSAPATALLRSVRGSTRASTSSRGSSSWPFSASFLEAPLGSLVAVGLGISVDVVRPDIVAAEGDDLGMPWLMFPAPSTATCSIKLIRSTRTLRRPMNSPVARVEARPRLRSIEEGRRDARREFGGSPIVTSPKALERCSHYSNDLVRVCRPPVVERFQAIGSRELSHRYRRVLGSILSEYAGSPSEYSARESCELLAPVP